MQKVNLPWDVTLIGLALLGYAATHVQLFLLLATGTGIVSVVISPFWRVLALGFFLIPLLEAFTHSTYIPVSLATLIYIAILGRYIVTQLPYTRYYAPGLTITLIFIIYELLHVFVNPVMISSQTVRWLLLFVFVSLIIFDRKQYLDFKVVRWYLLIGLITSTLFGLIEQHFFPQIVHNSKVIARFSGATGDPNNFGLLCLLILFFYLPIQPKEFVGKKAFLVMAIVLGCGSLTVSRSFFIVTVLTLGLYFILYYRAALGDILFRTLIAILFGIFGVVVLLFTSEQIQFNFAILERFQGDNLSDLTGARSDIVKEYFLQYISLPMQYVLFGAGINGYLGYYNHFFAQKSLFPDVVGPHNTPLEILVSFGAIGSLIVVAYVVIAFKAERSRLYFSQVGKMAFIPLIVFLLYCLSLQNLGKYSSFFILLAIIICCYRKPAS